MKRNFAHLLLLPLAVLACQPQPSQLHHDVGRFSSGDLPMSWIEITDAEYARVTTGGEWVVDPNSPLTRRMEAWADAIREAMIKVDPNVRKAPVPKIRIQDVDDSNAFVASAEVCFDLTIEIGDQVEPIVDNSGRELFIHPKTGGGESAARLPSCKAGEGSFQEKIELLRKLYSGNKDCKITANGVTAHLSESCAEGLSGQKVSSFGAYLTHNYVTFYRGLLEQLTEEEVIAVLAHELTHYYMNHVTSNRLDYNYFYQLNASNPIGKPARLPDDHPIQLLGEKLRTIRLLKFVPIPGQELHTLSYPFVKRIMKERFAGHKPADLICMPNNDSCINSCERLVEQLSSNYDGAFGQLPASISFQTPFAVFEEDVRQCFKDVSAIPFVEFTNEYLYEDLHFDTHTTVGAPAGQTFYDFLKNLGPMLDAEADRRRETQAQLMIDARNQQLGWYTTEQEADEVAVDIMNRLGLSVRAGITGAFKRLQRNPEEYDKCMTAYEDNFPDILIPDNYTENHHDWCFRVFNQKRELDVHGAEFAATRAPQPVAIEDGYDWDTLVKNIEAQFNTAALIANYPGIAAFNDRLVAHGCQLDDLKGILCTALPEDVESLEQLWDMLQGSSEVDRVLADNYAVGAFFRGACLEIINQIEESKPIKDKVQSFETASQAFKDRLGIQAIGYDKRWSKAELGVIAKLMEDFILNCARANEIRKHNITKVIFTQSSSMVIGDFVLANVAIQDEQLGKLLLQTPLKQTEIPQNPAQKIPSGPWPSRRLRCIGSAT